jgi:MFS family permease
VSFAVKASSGAGDYEKAVSIPPYPPQVCSSFISFASFSTSVMSSMSTSAYYTDYFADTASGAVNVGLVISLFLIVLLICMELAGAYVDERIGNVSAIQLTGSVAALSRFRIAFSGLTWILFIIFIGIVFTKIVMILSST